MSLQKIRTGEVGRGTWKYHYILRILPMNYTEICSLHEYGINMRIDENCVAGIMMLLV